MSKTIYGCAAVLWLCSTAFNTARGSDAAKFLGANSCSTSSCHGGGGANQNQFLIWSLKDFHSQRPAATLTTARAKQIAAALSIQDPATDARCTICHTPLQQVPEEQHGDNFKISEAVSCESCHGPAENWLRAHTRKDWTHADRTAAGMRDLQNLYVRANTCVACHQNVDANILAAGHPELIFELDGQSVAEPKHWPESTGWNGAQTWFVGQAAALREMSWQLSRETTPTENQMNRWRGLVWLADRARQTEPGLPSPPDLTFRPNAEKFALVQYWGDTLAIAAAKLAWTDKLSQTALAILANTSADFREAVPQPVNARRAERLVLALDRLITALPELKKNEPVQSALNQLFKLAQSIPDFDSKKFADALDHLAVLLKHRG